MPYAHTVDAVTWRFPDLRTLLARASPLRSGDVLAGVAAATAEERVAARMALADVPLAAFLTEAVVPYEDDDVTRLIVDAHDKAAFAPVASLTVGAFREWLLESSSESVSALARGLTPEMAAAVSKLMRNQDLVSVARKCRVVTRFRNTLGLPGRLAVRIQPNHPTDDVRGIAASMLEGLSYGCGDAVIGINPAGDGLSAFLPLWRMMDELIRRFGIPTQSCVLTHVTSQVQAIERGAPVDLVFQTSASQLRAQALESTRGRFPALIAQETTRFLRDFTLIRTYGTCGHGHRQARHRSGMGGTGVVRTRAGRTACERSGTAARTGTDSRARRPGTAGGLQLGCKSAARRDRLFRPPATRQAMKMHYDEKVDALYLTLDDSAVVESEEVKPGIVLDFNADNQVVGIEVLDLRKRVPSANLKEMQFDVA